MAVCSQPGQPKIVTVPPYTASPPDVSIVSASFTPQYPVHGQYGAAVITISNTGGQGVSAVVNGQLIRSGTAGPVEGNLQEYVAWVNPGQSVSFSISTKGTMTWAQCIDWTGAPAYGWLDCIINLYYGSTVKHYVISHALRLPDRPPELAPTCP